MLITEELLLLALDDDSGKLSSIAAGDFRYGIAGGLLMDLIFNEKVKIFKDIEHKKNVIKIIAKEIEKKGISTPSDRLLNQVLTIIQKYEGEKTIERLIDLLSNHYQEFRKMLFASLVEQGVLRREEKVRLKIFKFVRHPINLLEVKENLLQRIQVVILEGKRADEQLISLLCIVRVIGMIDTVFSEEYRVSAAKKIDEIAQSDTISSTIKHMIDVMHETLMAVMMASNSPLMNFY
ncbi:MAG: GOLPH3/VPS74 family protein [Promethearchaeota archaeon]